MEEHITCIGKRNIWGQETLFGISVCDRRHHLYIIGKSGSGKTTLLKNLILQDIEAGHGVGIIDPHGDLAETLLDQIPSRRTDDVAYFNPADLEYPIGLNLLQTKEYPHLVASGIVSAFKSIWRDSWGPRLEYIMYASVAALLECENTTLLCVQRMLTDHRYRAWVVRQVKDPMVRSFWLNEFESYDPRFLNEVIAPIQNKVGQLFMAAPVRNILGQVRSRINPRFMMDNKRIFIGNLSKGRLGEDKANLLGALLVTQFQLAAMARADIVEEKRRDFFLYIDEFHNFSTDSFASILSEARKYRLCLTLSHQYVGQLVPVIRDAVFGNVGSIVSFRVGSGDANILALEFGEEYDPRILTELANYEVCAKLLNDGRNSLSFLGTTLPPWGNDYRRHDNIIRRSREKYATRRAVVEDRISRWIGNT
jgi:hypothetical protein